jgi:deoxyribose-phosphate aldolase
MGDSLLQAHARTALACLDLTSLNDADTEADVERLCERAQGPHGPVAAVCVWPRFAALARARLPASTAVAAVANFPGGGTDTERAVREAAAIVQAGAQEVDLVLPWRALQAGDERTCSALLSAVRRACEGRVLKVILESGELQDPRLIRRAAELAFEAGADFLKTSTGKTPVSATAEAANVMLGAIAADPTARNRVGFKASGGIRTVADAALYIGLVATLLGDAAVRPQRFRIGASALLNDIEAVLGGTHAAPTKGY